jgi:hypothetical protein
MKIEPCEWENNKTHDNWGIALIKNHLAYPIIKKDPVFCTTRKFLLPFPIQNA